MRSLQFRWKRAARFQRNFGLRVKPARPNVSFARDVVAADMPSPLRQF
jgi:hypothetical protein